MHTTAQEPVLLLSAQLTNQSKNIHGGSFRVLERAHLDRLETGINLVLRDGPAILEGLANGTLRMMLLHDQEAYMHNSTYRGVELRYISQRMNRPGNDVRWQHYRDVLYQEIGMRCVFAIDFGDVYPTTAALHRLCDAHPGKLLLASDACAWRQTWGWVDHARTVSNFSASDAFNQILVAKPKDRVVYNCGIMGGRAQVVHSVIAHMAARIDAHYTSMEARGLQVKMCVDMLTIWETLHELRTPVYTGYPLGRVNLPMHGNFCGWSQCSNQSYAYHGKPDCQKYELSHMTQTHFFRHKLGCGKTIPCDAGAPIVHRWHPDHVQDALAANLSYAKALIHARYYDRSRDAIPGDGF